MVQTRQQKKNLVEKKKLSLMTRAKNAVERLYKIDYNGSASEYRRIRKLLTQAKRYGPLLRKAQIPTPFRNAHANAISKTNNYVLKIDNRRRRDPRPLEGWRDHGAIYNAIINAESALINLRMAHRTMAEKEWWRVYLAKRLQNFPYITRGERLKYLHKFNKGKGKSRQNTNTLLRTAEKVNDKRRKAVAGNANLRRRLLGKR